MPHISHTAHRQFAQRHHSKLPAHAFKKYLASSISALLILCVFVIANISGPTSLTLFIADQNSSTSEFALPLQRSSFVEPRQLSADGGAQPELDALHTSANQINYVANELIAQRIDRRNFFDHRQRQFSHTLNSRAPPRPS